jgi:MFS family permease
MSLCLPYASVYMLSLGVSDRQLGLVTSLGMLSQVFFGLLGGVVTDKLGRRLTTAIFDFVAWCLPCVIWCAASLVDQRLAFSFFVGAALVNGALQVTQNSWDCLMVEDADRRQLTNIYSLVIIAGQMSALFAPIAAVLVSQFALVPAVRILYINAFVVMLIKLLVLYRWSTETATGRVRMVETAGVPLRTLLAGYGAVIRLALRSPGTIFSLLVAVLTGAVTSVNGAFWQVIVSQKLMVPLELLPIWTMARSLLAILFLLLVVPRLTRSVAAHHLRRSLLAGFLVYAVGQAILAMILAPTGPADGLTYLLIAVSSIGDCFGAGIMAMLAESLVALHVDPDERSRVMAVQRTSIMLVVAPFGWIAGVLSSFDRSWPFVLTSGLLLVGAVVTWGYYRRRHGDQLPAPVNS